MIFYRFNLKETTHSGGVPRRPNELNFNSTRCRGPAKNIYTHCLESPSGLIIVGAWKVPFGGPSGVLINFWSHSVKLYMRLNIFHMWKSSVDVLFNTTLLVSKITTYTHCWLTINLLLLQFFRQPTTVRMIQLNASQFRYI